MLPDMTLFPARRGIPLLSPEVDDYLENKQSLIEAGQLTGKRR